MTDEPDPLYDALVRAWPGEYGAGPEELVQALLRRPEWHQRAACRGVGADVFHIGQGGDMGPAKRLCADCPVTDQCLDAGLSVPFQFGIWGGTTPAQRGKLRRSAA